MPEIREEEEAGEGEAAAVVAAEEVRKEGCGG